MNTGQICMSSDDLEKIKKFEYDKGIIEARAHINPSPETKQTFKFMDEKMTKIEIKMQKLEGNQELHGEILRRIEEKIDTNNLDFKNHINKENDFISSADDRYAMKDTVKTLIGVVITIFTGTAIAVIVAIIKYFIK